MNERFGVLEALNDFVVENSQGFKPHPHQEMEIISYCVEGELTHGDDMGKKNTLKRGDVQYLCAGSGVVHSEMNASADCELRFLQIWISPEKSGLPPAYRSRRYSRDARRNKLLHIVSGDAHDGVIQIAQDANIYVAELEQHERLEFSNHHDRQAYLVCLEGGVVVNDVELNKRDALKINGEVLLDLTAHEDSHFLMVEMPTVR